MKRVQRFTYPSDDGDYWHCEKPERMEKIYAHRIMIGTLWALFLISLFLFVLNLLRFIDFLMPLK